LRFGLYGLHKGDNVAPEVLADRARRAEDAGFDSLWVGDHVALPADALDDPEEPRLEAVVALSHLAALTRRVRLVFGVIVLPQRQPVLLAKQISSLDALSGGRLTVGIGVGYVEAELQALGVELSERGARADEYVEAMRALWDGAPGRFEGRFVSFADVIERPRPIQRPHPPLIVGGHADAALRRAARVASGWFGWELSPAEAAEAIARLRAAAGGDERRRLEISVRPDRDIDMDLVRRYAEVGVDRLVLEPDSSTGTAMDRLIAMAGETLIASPA
jgi:probable F420-dependent oxidoreductase